MNYLVLKKKETNHQSWFYINDLNKHIKRWMYSLFSPFCFSMRLLWKNEKMHASLNLSVAWIQTTYTHTLLHTLSHMRTHTVCEKWKKICHKLYFDTSGLMLEGGFLCTALMRHQRHGEGWFEIWARTCSSQRQYSPPDFPWQAGKKYLLTVCCQHSAGQW